MIFCDACYAPENAGLTEIPKQAFAEPITELRLQERHCIFGKNLVFRARAVRERYFFRIARLNAYIVKTEKSVPAAADIM